jgi:hypothetical protein
LSVQPVLRINGAEVKFGDEIPCTDPVYISSDFIYVRCTDNGQNVYSGLQYGIDDWLICSNPSESIYTNGSLDLHFIGFTSQKKSDIDE